MICTRLHLTERRLKPLPSIQDGPIIRPCSNRFLVSKNDSPRSTRSATPSIAVNDGEEQQQNLNKLCDDEEVKETELQNTISQSCHMKTPLIVVTLSIPPDIETLAPKDIKRDPRKQPPFCQQYLTISKNLFEHKKDILLPEIHIQGVEIIENKNEISEDLMLHDISINEPNQLFGVNGELLINFDGFEMDSYGHLPGDSRTPTPTDANNDECRPVSKKRSPSPSTRQIIRVDVSVNRDSLNKNNF